MQQNQNDPRNQDQITQKTNEDFNKEKPFPGDEDLEQTELGEEETEYEDNDSETIENQRNHDLNDEENEEDTIEENLDEASDTNSRTEDRDQNDSVKSI